jgi:hypothetical protein
MRISLTLLAICLALPTPGICGGNEWPFYVSVAPAASGCTVVQLKPAEIGKDFPLSCKQFTLSACYNWSWWQLHKPVSRSEHERAIGFLLHAQSEGIAVRFGAMGEGFGNVVKGEACQASSAALQIVDGNAVYSYFKWP